MSSRNADEGVREASGETDARGEARVSRVAGWPIDLDLHSLVWKAEYELEWQAVQDGPVELVLGGQQSHR